MKTFGMTDSVTTCDCCGKKDLLRTVAMEANPHGDVVYYGTHCATRKHGLKTQPKHLAQIMAIADDVAENPPSRTMNNFGQFVKAVSRQGFSGEVKSPLTDNVAQCEWHWSDFKITASYFNQ